MILRFKIRQFSLPSLERKARAGETTAMVAVAGGVGRGAAGTEGSRRSPAPAAAGAGLRRKPPVLVAGEAG